MLMFLVGAYCLIALCAAAAVLEDYSSRLALEGKADPSFWETIGCLLAGALWPAVVIVKLFGLLFKL